MAIVGAFCVLLRQTHAVSTSNPFDTADIEICKLLLLRSDGTRQVVRMIGKAKERPEEFEMFTNSSNGIEEIWHVQHEGRKRLPRDWQQEWKLKLFFYQSPMAYLPGSCQTRPCKQGQLKDTSTSSFLHLWLSAKYSKHRRKSFSKLPWLYYAALLVRVPTDTNNALR